MDTQTLKNILERLVRERDAVKEGLDVVIAVQGLAQEAADLENKILGLKMQQAALKESVEKVNDVVENGKKEAAEIVKAAKIQASDIVAKAIADAKEAVKKADDKANQIAEEINGLGRAKQGAESELADLRKLVVSMQDDVAALEKIKADARKALGV